MAPHIRNRLDLVRLGVGGNLGVGVKAGKHRMGESGYDDHAEIVGDYEAESDTE